VLVSLPYSPLIPLSFSPILFEILKRSRRTPQIFRGRVLLKRPPPLLVPRALECSDAPPPVTWNLNDIIGPPHPFIAPEKSEMSILDWDANLFSLAPPPLQLSGHSTDPFWFCDYIEAMPDDAARLPELLCAAHDKLARLTMTSECGMDGSVTCGGA